jgi:hypothetical protein
MQRSIRSAHSAAAPNNLAKAPLSSHKPFTFCGPSFSVYGTGPPRPPPASAGAVGATLTGGCFALDEQDTFILLSFQQPGADRRGLKIAAVVGGGLALSAAAATAAVLVVSLPARAPADPAARVAIPLRESPDPTAAEAAVQPVSVSTTARPVRAGELDCLTQAVYYEARGEAPSGQAAVAQVVMNRVRHPAFPKTVCGVVYQGARTHGCQFSFACDGWAATPRESGAWRRAREIAARALVGVVAPQVLGATHFHNARVAPGWGPGLMRVAQVGLHVFYRFGAPVTAAPGHGPETVSFVKLDAGAADAQAPAADLQLAEAVTAVPAAPPEPKPAPPPKAVSADSKGVDAALRTESATR